MRKVTAAYVIDCGIDTYWEIFLDAAFTRELHREDLATRQLDVLEQTETTRRLRVAPKLNMPQAVQKLLGPSFVYEEQGRLDRATNTWHWTVIPSVMADRLHTSGSYRLEPLEGGSTRRVDEATLEAKVFGIGTMLESSTEKQILETWAHEAAAVNRWAKRRS